MANLMKQTTQHASKSQSAIPIRQLLNLSLLANTFEWYEFSVFGYLSTLMGQLFFDGNPAEGLLKGFLSLAMGYFARPFGSLFFGFRGDQMGRRYALRLSLLLMAIPTALIGFLPTYQQAGMLATIALLILRVIQGFAAGGESPATACYVFEGANNNYRSLLCSSAAMGPSLGMLLGSAIYYLLTTYFSQTELLAWAWRIPFLLSIPLSLFIGYFRRTLPETPPFLQKLQSKKSSQPPYSSLTWPLTASFFIFALLNAEAAILKIWMPFYLTHFLSIPLQTANLTNIIVLISMIPCYILCGYLAQRWGYQRVLIASIIACLLCSVPLFKLLQIQTTFFGLCCLQIILALFVSTSNGLYVEIAGNLFPVENRSLGVNLACTLPATVIGGTIPFICTYVLQQTGWLLFPAYYMMGFALIALPFAWHLKPSSYT